MAFGVAMLLGAAYGVCTRVLPGAHTLQLTLALTSFSCSLVGAYATFTRAASTRPTRD